MRKVVAVEYSGSPSRRRNAFVEEDGRILKGRSGRRRFDFDVGHVFNEVFFPEGYPESVSRDYLSYQIFDTIQAFCSSINGTIATQSIMRGLGVGKQESTALAATLTWILKDGFGMVGRIAFAWAQGTDLDCDMKRWRLRADVLNDIAMFLDVISGYFGNYFAFIVCMSSLLRAIVGIAGMGTRPAIIQHQARRNNIGDVAAKDSSQETLVNLAALLTSLIIMPILDGSQWLSWISFFLLAAVHIAANYFAVRSLALETFNQARFHIATRIFFKTGGSVVPSVVEVNFQEPVVFSVRRRWSMDVGSRIPLIGFRPDDLRFIRDLYGDGPFSLQFDELTGTVRIFLAPYATPVDVLYACFEAELGTQLMESKGMSSREAQRSAKQESTKLFQQFCRLAQDEGWDLTRNYLGAKEWRINWKVNPDEEENVTVL